MITTSATFCPTLGCGRKIKISVQIINYHQLNPQQSSTLSVSLCPLEPHYIGSFELVLITLDDHRDMGAILMKLYELLPARRYRLNTLATPSRPPYKDRHSPTELKSELPRSCIASNCFQLILLTNTPPLHKSQPTLARYPNTETYTHTHTCC